MGTIADTSLVSNKVFTAIQPWQIFYKEHTGTVIYANKYADVAEVPMPDNLRAILESDAGAVGNNPIVQLQGKLSYFPDGPWYTDCRNGMLYIHNKKFREDSIHTYVYQSENGEVLRVSFETQRIQHHDISKALTIKPETKEVESDKGASEQTPEKEYLRYIERNDNTSVYNPWRQWTNEVLYGAKKHTFKQMMEADEKRKLQDWKSSFGFTTAQEAFTEFTKVADEKSLFTIKQSEDWQVQNQINLQNKTLTDNQALEEAKRQIYSKESAKEWDKRVDYVNNHGGGNLSPKTKTQTDFVNNVNTETAKVLEGISAEIGHIIYKHTHKKKKTNPTSDLKDLFNKYFKNAKHVYAAQVYTEEYVDPTTYNKSDSSFTKSPILVPVKERGSEGMMDPNKIPVSVRDKLRELNKDPSIMVMGELEINPDDHRRFRIKVFRKAWRKLAVSLVDQLLDYSLRRAGFDAQTNQWLADAQKNKMDNALKSWTEIKLLVKMDVVGRPSLATSQVLTLLNVGTRWSGIYYVKECTHKMDASEGYICSLVLSSNNVKVGTKVNQEKLNTNHIIKEVNDKGKDISQNKKSRGITVTTSKPSISTSSTSTSSKTYRPKSRSRSKTYSHKKKSSKKR